MTVEILSDPFNPWERLQGHEAGRSSLQGRFGATAVFVGTMRDFNQDEGIQAMNLEYYPGMTERYLEKLSEEAAQRWWLLDSLILHRVGKLKPHDPIVLVAVWSVHRKDAFEASRWLMEELKSRAPFWKKETLADASERWVEKNTEGY